MRDDIDTFIQDTLYITERTALRRYFIDFMKKYGFDMISYHYVADNFRKIPIETAFPINTLPSWWNETYIESDYFEIDPVAEEARKNPLPFYIPDIAKRSDLTPAQKAFLDDLDTAGIHNSIAVPVYARLGEIAHFCLGKHGAKEVKLSLAELLEIQAICQHMHIRFNEISKKRPAPKLSVREVQVLELIARGKSNTAISKDLGVSPNTIDTLVRRCFEKLGVTSRVEAALAGVGQGLILP
ncbi:helix-turn-helix transcriptional regulator [Hyphococcus sp. DH-69]|uniref:helix-turn-helix transcriptional regulator n=1 Tax=Hyphococcus formosus TaxID=3143534 RepID=UPI00398ADF98